MSRVPQLIPLGEVMGAHGVLGALKVKLHNPDSELLSTLECVHVRREGKPAQVRRVEHVRAHGKGLLMHLSGCVDRDQARALYGAQLCVPRAMLPKPAAEEFYLVDALGARVELPDGRSVGTVESFRAYPSVDVFCVRGGDGMREVPLIAPYLVRVDEKEKVVVVDHYYDLDVEPETKRRR